MQLAITINDSRIHYLEKGEEWVFAQPYMLRDVYYHEGDPLPTLEDFSEKWLTRPNGGEFWVYRQGTPINTYHFSDGMTPLIILLAKTADLDASEASIEGYYYIPTICLKTAHWFTFSSMMATRDEIQKTQEALYKDVRNYGN